MKDREEEAHLDPIEDELHVESKEHRVKLSAETINLTNIESQLVELKSILADGDISNRSRLHASEVIGSIKEALAKLDESLAND